MLNRNNDCVILANGAFPTDIRLLDLLKESSCIIACDGAVNKLVMQNIMPHFIVGDLDSLSDQLKADFSGILQHNPDQETNDLTKAVRFAVEQGFKRPVILGATGLREDHTLGNISLLTEYSCLFDEISLISDFGTFIPISRTSAFKCAPGQQVSLFAIFPFGSISTEGLKYPIHERKLPVWWEGTLNEAVSDNFTIKLDGEGHVLVYLCHQNR